MNRTRLNLTRKLQSRLKTKLAWVEKRYSLRILEKGYSHADFKNYTRMSFPKNESRMNFLNYTRIGPNKLILA